MRFTKIKSNGKTVELQWHESKLNGEEISHHLTSPDAPSPALPSALAAFVPIVLDLLQLPEDWSENLRVQSLSINHEKGDGRMGLVITCLKKLPDANAPLVLNTPHLRQPVNDDDTGPGFFIEGMGEALDDVLSAALGFYNGERAQGDLFPKAAA